jgi:hypothetical protein
MQRLDAVFGVIQRRDFSEIAGQEVRTSVTNAPG